MKPQRETAESESPRVILFTGHRIDAPGREQPRFPRDREAQARVMIEAAVSQVKENTKGGLIGIAGGASGGDILFLEVCEELDIPTTMYLAIPKDDYIEASVADGGPVWVARFDRLFDRKPPKFLADADESPNWLRSDAEYNVWQRTNLWMLYRSLEISNDNLTLVALWNGDVGDGPGGTEDMVKRARDRGATIIHLDARKLLE